MNLIGKEVENHGKLQYLLLLTCNFLSISSEQIQAMVQVKLNILYLYYILCFLNSCEHSLNMIQFLYEQ